MFVSMILSREGKGMFGSPLPTATCEPRRPMLAQMIESLISAVLS